MKYTYLIQNGCVTANFDFSDDSVQMIEADVVFGTVTLSSPAKTGMGFNAAFHLVHHRNDRNHVAFVSKFKKVKIDSSSLPSSCDGSSPS